MQKTHEIIKNYNLDWYTLEHLIELKNEIESKDGCIKLYLYEGHMGGLYISDELYSYDRLYCDSCGDSDNLITSGTKEYLINIIDFAIVKSKENDDVIDNY